MRQAQRVSAHLQIHLRFGSGLNYRVKGYHLQIGRRVQSAVLQHGILADGACEMTPMVWSYTSKPIWLADQQTSVAPRRYVMARLTAKRVLRSAGNMPMHEKAQQHRVVA